MDNPSRRPQSEQRATHRAAIGLVGSAVLFAAMAVGARVAAERIPGPQIAFLRFAIGILVVLGVMASGRTIIRPQRWRWIVARGLFGGVAVLAYFTCIERVGVGIATLLLYTAPVWAMLFGWWLLGEQPRGSAVAALGLTLVGVGFVLGGRVGMMRPGFWELVGLLGAVASGLAVTSVRAARRQGPGGVEGENLWTVFASFTALGALATLPAAIAPFGVWVAPRSGEWLVIVGVGLVSIAAQLLLTHALAHITATTSGIIHQLTVVIAMVCGVLFFEEVLSWRSFFGSVLTIGGVVWAVLASARRAPLAPDWGRR